MSAHVPLKLPEDALRLLRNLAVMMDTEYQERYEISDELREKLGFDDPVAFQGAADYLKLHAHDWFGAKPIWNGKPPLIDVEDNGTELVAHGLETAWSAYNAWLAAEGQEP